MLQKNTKNTRVVIAMSGGIDSSVAAYLLKQQGYDLIGITIKTYRYEDVGGNENNDTSCCSLDGINDARKVAHQLGFPHYVLDFSDVFFEKIISNFTNEYLEGRTPNPCVICNREIKWSELIKKSEQLGACFIATGHYAKTYFDEKKNRYVLFAGKDKTKDQSYALWNLTQHSLSKTLFPLFDLTKDEVRKIALENNLVTLQKKESFEICFITDNNYERFLKEQIPTLEQSVQNGQIIFENKVIGTHRGYPFYTIGQRKGIGTAVGEPIYVTEIDAKTNTIFVGRNENLLHKKLIAESPNIISYDDLKTAINIKAKIRYKDEGSDAVAFVDESGKLNVTFAEPKRAITSGQSVVLYNGDEVIGGGIIEKHLD